MMKALTAIPFSLDADAIMRQVQVDVGSRDAADLLALIDVAREIGRPKAAYAPAFITARDDDKVQIEDVWFTSRTLAHNLESAERVFAMVATCGHEMDQGFPAKGDILQAFWWDMIKTRLLGAASTFLSDHLHATFRLGKTATMRPGSGDASVWPIEQQHSLFRLLDGVEQELGVQLTDSSLMIPNKCVFPS